VTANVGVGSLGSALRERIDPRARSRLEVRESGPAIFLEAELHGVFRTVFTSRLGGISEGPFASLNLDARSADEPGAVEQNRARVMGILEADDTVAEAEAGFGRRFVNPLQAHGVRVVGAAEYVRDHDGTPCDGLTLNPNLDSGLAALLLFADCVPVVLVGEVDMAVVHGGWRGILGGVVQQGGRAMTSSPGGAIIGPSIGPCCFTVGEEVAQAFAGRYGPEVVVTPGLAGPAPAGGRPGGRPGLAGPEADAAAAAGSGVASVYRIDLWAAVTKALAEVGVNEGQVVNPRLCTACNKDFFYSYRREGPVTGRQGCIVWTVET
jgi:purine-nucleoside/S-methyl-5'-thioadenosine phosphorylase / adenosine deaminase